MSAAEAVSDFIAALLPTWTCTPGLWNDEEAPKTSRFAIVKPAGGARAELIRRPEMILYLIGADGDAPKVVQDAADTVIEAMRESAGTLVFMQPGEPALNQTTDRRPVAQLAISAITN